MKTYRLEDNVLILLQDGIEVGSFHRLACPDWDIPSFRAWASGFGPERGYNPHTVVSMGVDWSTLEEESNEPVPDYGDHPWDQMEEYHKNCM